MRLPNIIMPLVALSLLGVMDACGGGYTPPPAPAVVPSAPATGLVYSNPAAGGWALVRNSASTPTHLLLDLVGPSGLKARGVGFNLGSDGSVKFHRYADGNYVKDTGVFQLKLTVPNLYTTTFPNFYEPVLMVGGVKNGGTLLTTGLFQKDRMQPAQALTAPLCQIGVDFDATKGLASGATIPLTLVRARIIPEDIGAQPTNPNGDWSDVLNKFRLVDIQIAVGSLKAQ